MIQDLGFTCDGLFFGTLFISVDFFFLRLARAWSVFVFWPSPSLQSFLLRFHKFL